MTEGRKRNLSPVSRVDVYVFERLWILLKLRISFEHDVILIQLGKNRGDLALSESVVKRIVDGLRQNAEPGSGITINHQVSFETTVLLITGHVAHRWQVPQFVHESRRPQGQFLSASVFHRVLIYLPANPTFHRQALHGFPIQSDAFHFAYTGLQSPNNLAVVE